MPINNNVAALFKEYNFSFPNEIKIKKTICRYAKPSGFCDTLHYVIFRIRNFFLSLICCSEWQRTQRSIKKDAYTLLNESKHLFRALYTLGGDKKLVDEQIEQVEIIFKPTAEYLSQNFLKLALDLQNNKDCSGEVESFKILCNWQRRIASQKIVRTMVNLVVEDSLTLAI